jgi:hypothetical protein
MINEAQLKDLLARRAEFKNLDFKRDMNWTSATNEAKCELVKDILSMMNIQDGGQIILGVDDATCDPLGMSAEDVMSFDPTKINDFVHKYSDPPSSCDVQKLIVDSKTFVVIDVREFSDVPIICKADAASSNNRQILKRGGLYTRTDKPSSELVCTPEQMRDLMARSMMKRSDQLLRTIQGLFAGSSGSSPEEHTVAYANELAEAVAFIGGTLPEEVMQQGFFEVSAMPITYSAERVSSLTELSHAIQQAEVSLRGWNYPHIDRENIANFDSGRQSFTIWNSSVHRHVESFRAYTSGFFLWRGAYWEDAPTHSGNGPKLSWVSLIFEITEFFLFLSRFYARIAEEASIKISIRLTNTNGRRLASFEQEFLHNDYVCQAPEISITRTYTVSHLRAAYEIEARSLIKRIFEIFHWSSSPSQDNLIEQKQRQLIERRF